EHLPYKQGVDGSNPSSPTIKNLIISLYEVLYVSCRMYYFYILYSKTTGLYYIDHTGELSGRIKRHKSRHKGFTNKTPDWEL
ncbi:MAG: GIY-YIG nuclease family protein, partial [Bacteroidales bacterium]